MEYTFVRCSRRDWTLLQADGARSTALLTVRDILDEQIAHKLA